MNWRPRLADLVLGGFALLLVLAVVHRAEHVRSHERQVGHAHAQVRKV
jgi:hypothetical protein